MTTLGLVLAIACVGASPPTLHPILDPGFQKALGTETNSVLAVSDEIQLLVDGKESYPVRWRMLEEARHTIHFSTMYIFPDPTTERLRDLLLRKKSEAVDIKMIVYGPYTIGNRSFFNAMRRAGIEVKSYSSVPEVALRNPLRFWTRHLHDKSLVVDGAEAIVGGMNWSNRYASGGLHADKAWRDTDLWVKGPQAQIVEKEFLRRWYREDAPVAAQEISEELDTIHACGVFPVSTDLSARLAEDTSAPSGYRVKGLTRFLYQQPYEQDGAALMTAFYRRVIDQARTHVYWQSIGARPSTVQKQALVDAAARGVDVRLMTNSEPNMAMIPIGGPAVYALTRHAYAELLKAGIRVFEYHGDAPLHSKGFLIDDVLAVIGSYNASFTAEKYYTESALAVYDTDAVLAVHKMLDDDFARCTEVTLDNLHNKRTP